MQHLVDRALSALGVRFVPRNPAATPAASYRVTTRSEDGEVATQSVPVEDLNELMDMFLRAAEAGYHVEFDIRAES